MAVIPSTMGLKVEWDFLPLKRGLEPRLETGEIPLNVNLLALDLLGSLFLEMTNFFFLQSWLIWVLQVLDVFRKNVLEKQTLMSKHERRVRTSFQLDFPTMTARNLSL